MSAERDGAQPTTEGGSAQTAEQAFFERWHSWEFDLYGPTGLDVRDLVLDEEPPRATVVHERSSDAVTFVMGRGAMPAVYRVDEDQRLLSVRQAATLLDVPAPLVQGAQAAVLDGLEQAEAAAGRGPRDRAPAPATPWRVVQGQQPGTAHPEAVRDLNQERMQRQAPAGIRGEELGSPSHRTGVRRSR